ncbi:hypothetical protein AURDEDRAFT_172613 [Auricularia subglabra TFB-10046 SS5]|nr:hypothetical protein AURDEDRAFT_172613 [Auricularia subglabra TFB-10046 SS5]
MSQDQKPDTKPRITLRILVTGREEITVKAPSNKPLQRTFDAVCNKLGITAAELRFTYDGERIRGEDTPAGLGMLDDDGAKEGGAGVELQAHPFQVGGAR